MDFNKLPTFGCADYTESTNSYFHENGIKNPFSKLTIVSVPCDILRAIKGNGGEITRLELNQQMGWPGIVTVDDWDYRKNKRWVRMRVSNHNNSLLAKMRYHGLIKYENRKIKLGDNFAALEQEHPDWFD